MRSEVVVFLIALCLGCSRSTAPGVEVRVTQAGLNNVNQYAVKKLEQGAISHRLPDQEARKGRVKCKASSMTVTKFQIQRSGISLRPGAGLVYSLSSANIGVKGRLRCRAAFVRKTNDFDITATGINMKVNIGFGFNPHTGKSTVSLSGCTGRVSGGVSVRFHGSGSWIFNLIRNQIAKILQKEINKQICSQSTISKVNKKIQTVLNNIPDSRTVLKDFLVDYRMVSKPQIFTNFVETYHKGEVFWKTRGQEAPFSPPKMGPATGMKKMVSVQISQYLLNTMAYVAEKNNYFSFAVTPQSLPPNVNKVYLNTTCSSMCIGKLMPAIGKTYPNQVVNIVLKSLSPAPKLTITKDKMQIFGKGMSTFYINHIDARHFLFSVELDLNATFNASITQGKVYYHVINIKLHMRLVKKTLDVNISNLKNTINTGLRIFGIPYINKLGQKGTAIPLSKYVTLKNTELKLQETSVEVDSDFSLLRTVLDDEEDALFLKARHSFEVVGQYRDGVVIL